MPTPTKTELQEQIQDLRDQEATERAKYDLPDRLADERGNLERQLEQRLAEENEAAAHSAAEKIKASHDDSLAGLLAAFDEFDSAVSKVSDATAAHWAGVSNGVTVAEHYGDAVGPFRVNRYSGVQVDGRRLHFTPAAALGRIAKSLEGITAALGDKSLSTDLRFLASSSPPLPKFFTEDRNERKSA